MFAIPLIYLSADLTKSISAASAYITALSFFDGAASASALMFLIALIASIASSSLAVSASKVRASS